MNSVYLFCLLTLGQGLFLAIYLLSSTRESWRLKGILATIVLIEVLTLYDEIILFFADNRLPISIFYIGTPLIVAIGPLVLAYIHFSAHPKALIKGGHLWHFVPSLGAIIMALFTYHILSYEEKVAYISYFQASYLIASHPKVPAEIAINTVLRAYLLTYVIVSWRYLSQVSTKYRSRVSVGFLQFLLVGLLVVAISALVNEVISFAVFSTWRIATFLVIFSSNIFGLTYIFFRPPKALVEADKYKRSGLSQKEEVQIKAKLKKALELDKVYTNPLLTLPKLAQMVGTNPHYISQVINSVYDKSYHELINWYRTEEAKRILGDPDIKLTTEEIATASGFASSSTFFRIFKAQTGDTPGQFRKRM